jgi:hypothetical protein
MTTRSPSNTRPLPVTGGGPRDVAQVVNNILQGKINSVGTVTLAANAATTTVNDSRVTANSAIIFTPQTAHAAAIALPYVLKANITEGVSYVITHANDANSDKVFAVALLG